MTASPHRYLAERPPHVPQDVAARALVVSERLRQRSVPALVSLRHLSLRARSDFMFLRAVVSRTVDAYELFDVRRRNGKPRTIAAPHPDLARTQRWILRRLLHRVEPHADSWAYFPERSAVKAAQRHVGAHWLIKVDLKDFFHQVDERMVFRLFESLGYSKLLAFELARICTRRAPLAHQTWLPPKYFAPSPGSGSRGPYERTSRLGYLPQGAPTSGAIANLVARPLDERLSRWAAAHQMTYTRYSDDIVLSGAPGTYVAAEARRHFAAIGGMIRNEGWETNRGKGRIVAPGSRLIVLGLLVDGDRVRLRREMRERIAEHLRGIEVFGPAQHAAHRNFRDAFGMLNHVRGLIEHTRSVDAALAERYDERLRPYDHW